MGFRFRIWMPTVAVLIVLLSIATILLYGLQTAKARLGGYVRDHATAQAAAAATAVENADPDGVKDALGPAADTSGGGALLVNREGDVVARSGEKVSDSLPNRVFKAASEGDRLNERIEDRRVATVPVIRNGGLQGGSCSSRATARRRSCRYFPAATSRPPR